MLVRICVFNQRKSNDLLLNGSDWPAVNRLHPIIVKLIESLLLRQLKVHKHWPNKMLSDLDSIHCSLISQGNCD